MDDATAARLLRRSYFRREWRTVHSLAAASRAYTPDEDRLLGTMTDARLGKLIGRSKYSIRKRRQRLGKSLLRRLRRDWTPEEDSLLGKFSDKEVARRLKRTYGSVQSRRLKLKVAPCHSQFTPWSAEQNGWIGVLRVEEIVRRTGRSIQAVRRRGSILRPDLFPRGLRWNGRAWLADEVQLLGTMPDAVLAAQLGRTRSSVSHKREKLGVPAIPTPPRRYEWTPEKDVLLRTHSDRALVRLWCVSPKTVRDRRRALNIPPLKRDKPWTAREIRLLWQWNNRSVAGRTGRTLAAINEQRQIRRAPHSCDLSGLPRHRRQIEAATVIAEKRKAKKK
ncbi:MAG TPA: hypothetical protein VGH42_14525 [Verrucomicrobiae bacterium]